MKENHKEKKRKNSKEREGSLGKEVAGKRREMWGRKKK